MMKTRIAIASIIMILCQSCLRVQVAIPNQWNERYAKSHDYIECLDADQLKHLITSDTTHYKIVMVYSSGCGACMEHLRRTYAPAYAMHRGDVKFYFISESTGGIKYCREELERLGMYDGKVLCFLDENPQYNNQNQGKDANLQVTTTPNSGSAIETAQLWQIDFDSIQSVDFDSIYRLDLDFDRFEGLNVCEGNQCPIQQKK